MIAYRLAEHVAHRTDVDAMLDEMTPEQFDEWCAKDLIEPIGYQTQMLGFIAYLLQAYMSDTQHKPDVNALMPWLRYVEAEDETPSTESAKQMILNAIGQHYGGTR